MKKKLLDFFPENKRGSINTAIQIADKCHKGKMRINREPELNHCLAAGLKTAEMGLGPKPVSAAILHDVLKYEEKREEYSSQIEEEMGKEVLDLVLEVTSMKNENAEKVGKFTDISSAQKYLLSSVSDMRVIMIKLAEKYHNLLTIDVHPKDKREKFLDEMEKIYLPLSEYLGLGSMHKQLADLMLMKKNRMKYDQINNFLTLTRKMSKKTKEEILDELKTVCEIENVNADVQGRTKSITSIFQKQQKYQREGKPSNLENILDVIAFRIMTSSIEDCYKVMSILVNLYDEIESETEDYIAKPKPNGYKSIHLCLKHPKKGTLEIQIRTKDMHIFNEFGPASHIAYKHSGKRVTKATDEYEWVKQLHQKNTVEDEPIKAELFKDQVFVFTPQGDILQLPNGSTVIDFAYSLHTKIGTQCAGARVNGKAVSLDTKLKTGDFIEIRIDKNKKHATEEWIDMAFTTIAKRNIKSSLGKKYSDSI
ncbi:MAG: HD domain-containing protein [bacterium]